MITIDGAIRTLRLPVHRLAGGENAFPLAAYTSAIERSGLRVERPVPGRLYSFVATKP